jgi:hypothetical protein
MEDNKIIAIKNGNNVNEVDTLKVFESGILETIKCYGLPTDNILVPIEERIVVYKNIEPVLHKIKEERKIDSVYFSKFLAAVAVGLFDAGLNYLWDETISEIRKRVIKYDIQYFYDNAVSGDEKRKKLKNSEDIVNLDDNELICGARKIELISELGFKHLDYIRYMRNWASAAHPNQIELTGLQLISWLETCIKEVFSLPLSNVAIETQQLLKNIRTNELSEDDAKKIATSFINLNQYQVNNLASGFLGIYLDPVSSPMVIQNINYLLPKLWARIDETSRQDFGVKYGNSVVNNDKDRGVKIKNFLDIVDGLSYIPDNIKVFEIESTVQNLLSAHYAMNNFYNEPIFARQLFRLINNSSIPKQASRMVVLGAVKVFLTNGYGVANSAEPYYIDIIKNFDQRESLLALMSFTDEQVASKLQFNLCQEKFQELLILIKGKLSAPAIKELFEEVDKYSGRLEKIKDNSEIKRKFENIKIILK